jgi:TPP-dependent indolepyruvate ferredoxin oxidoreductase alpha subunit
MIGVGGQTANTDRGDRKAAGAQKPVAAIDQSRCDGAPGCPVSYVCPKQAVVHDPDAPPTQDQDRSWLGSLFGQAAPVKWVVDQDLCTGCLLCAQYCPHKAVVPGERTTSA